MTGTENLKVGDIRHFTFTWGETLLGIWCGELFIGRDYSPTPYILTLERQFTAASKVMAVKSTRMDAETRAKYNKLAEMAKQLHKQHTDMLKLRKQMTDLAALSQKTRDTMVK